MSGVTYWCAECGNYKKLKNEPCEKCDSLKTETDDDPDDDCMCCDDEDDDDGSDQFFDSDRELHGS